MSEQRVQTYDLYLAAWSAISDADRERMLRVTSLTTSSSPIRSRPRAEIAEVIEHLEGFQVRTPGSSFRMNNLVGWGAPRVGRVV